jgi:hypothetical protein
MANVGGSILLYYLLVQGQLYGLTKPVLLSRLMNCWGFSTNPLMPLWILVNPTVQTLPGILQVSQCLSISSELDT